MRCTESSLACWECAVKFWAPIQNVPPTWTLSTHICRTLVRHTSCTESYYVFPQFSHHTKNACHSAVPSLQIWLTWVNGGSRIREAGWGGQSVLVFSPQIFSPCQRGVKMAESLTKGLTSPSISHTGRQRGWGEVIKGAEAGLAWRLEIGRGRWSVWIHVEGIR